MISAAATISKLLRNKARGAIRDSVETGSERACAICGGGKP